MVRIGVKPGQWGWSFDELEASWRAAEDAGFDVLSCFDHVTASPEGLAAWDAPSLLSAMAGRTTRIRLAVEVLNASLRHPFLLAGQLAVAQAASGGRLEVGIGAGSYHLARFDHRAIGVVFPPLEERIERLETCCRVLPALWRGESVTEPTLGLAEASLGPIGIEAPPLVVGGQGEATMRVAARSGDGWNGGSAAPDRFAALGRRLEELCQEVGRRRPITRTVQLFVRDLDVAAARDLLGSLADAGADTAVFVLHEERGPGAVERLAAAVL
jgi:alkanesulfonate monooxygenase SsuD/methylene tetrahydromethanopterin reductase-like flavin-dependent oxidoreductase (luciferase family)